MISTASLAAAKELSSIAEYSNVKLSPLGSTGLEIVYLTLANSVSNNTLEDIIKQSSVPGSTIGIHCEEEEILANKAAKIMGNIINIAKNTIIPHCNEVLRRIEEKEAQSKLAEVNLLGNIKMVAVPKLFSDVMFLDLIKDYTDIKPRPFNNLLSILYKIEQKTDNDLIRDIIKTNIANVDIKVEAFLNGYDFFNLLVDLRSSRSVTDVSSLTLKGAIYLFLLLNGIQNSQSDIITAILNEDETKYLVSSIRASCAGSINRNIKKITDCISKGDLLVRTNLFSNYVIEDPSYRQNTLVVYEENFKKWVSKNNGSPEAALGFLSEYGGVSSISAESDLKNNAEKYVGVYENKLKYAKTKGILENVKVVKEAINCYLDDLVRNEEPENKAVLRNRINKAMEHEYAGKSELKHYILKVLCRVFVDGDDVHKLLIEMDSLLTSERDMTSEEALYIGSIRLIGRWVARQIVKQK